MNPPTSMGATHNWKALYRAAIFEQNTSILPQRVSEAENAVIARTRELFHKSGVREERDELDGALYALRAFRSSYNHLKAA